MRLDEFTSAEDQLALWRLVSDSVWTAISIQAKQEAKAKAAKQRKGRAKQSVPKPVAPVQPVPMTKAQSVPAPQPQTTQKQPIKPVAVSGFGSVDAQSQPKSIAPKIP